MKITSFITTALFLLALPVSAQSVQAQGAASSSAGVSAGKAQVGLDVSGEAKAGMQGNAGNTEDNGRGEEQSEADTGGSMKGGNTKATTSDEERGNDVSVQAVEIRGWDTTQKQEFLATVKTHAQVRSEQDLENFAKGILVKDENVEEISSDEDSVEVRYRVPAKFLGLIDTTLPVTVVAAKAQGELGGGVQVHFPWYSFLFGVPDVVSETTLESDVATAVGADLDVDGSLDVAATARLYNAISNVLKTKHDTAKNSIGNIR
ncbi:MAG TPA: hypothetical protein VJH94_03855 [Candidatus Paceibacterota bacterium]